MTKKVADVLKEEGLSNNQVLMQIRSRDLAEPMEDKPCLSETDIGDFLRECAKRGEIGTQISLGIEIANRLMPTHLFVVVRTPGPVEEDV